jgi:hypothetical protein
VLPNNDSISREKFRSLGNFTGDSIFKKIFLRLIFWIEKKEKVLTEDHTTPFEGRMVAGSLQYPLGY